MSNPDPYPALLELEELFQSLFIGLPVGAFVVQDRRFRLFNPQFQKLLGYSRDELLAMDCLEPVVHKDRHVVRDNAVKWLKGQHLSPYEYRFVGKDGNVRWAMETVIPGQYRGERAALGYFVDITERKQAERILQESEQRYRDLADSLPEIVFELDGKGDITFANRNAFDSFGYTQTDLMKSVNIFQMVIPEDRGRLKERIRQILSGERLRATEYMAQRRDGSTFPVLVYSRPIMHENEPVGLRGIALDITEQKRLRENMQFYISQITKAQEEERRRIARELHDETAQSLAALSLDVEVITKSGDHLPDETLRLLEQLRAKIDSIQEEVRHFSEELRPDVLDQLGLVPALELLTTELSKEGKVSARIELIGSEMRLQPEAELVLFRIAQEALHNVRKHSQATEAVVKVEFVEKKVKLNVIDNGCGFELPNRLDDFVGTGKLGLIGMQERARLLDSSLTIKSEVGRGTTVTVEVATLAPRKR